MRLLADENVPRPIVRWLRSQGHDVLYSCGNAWAEVRRRSPERSRGSEPRHHHRRQGFRRTGLPRSPQQPWCDSSEVVGLSGIVPPGAAPSGLDDGRKQPPRPGRRRHRGQATRPCSGATTLREWFVGQCCAGEPPARAPRWQRLQPCLDPPLDKSSFIGRKIGFRDAVRSCDRLTRPIHSTRMRFRKRRYQESQQEPAAALAMGYTRRHRTSIIIP
jgi:hypothetical protein